MRSHEFNHSQKLEINTQLLHETAYEAFFKKANDKHPDKNISFSVDRKSCTYQSVEGKKYQKNDTDCLLTVDYNGKLGNRKKYQLKVSEKSRTNFFPDVLVEAISVLELTASGPKIRALGWGLKEEAENYSPQLMSMVFTKQGKNEFNSLIITQYPELKHHLQNAWHLEALATSPRFLQFITKIINDNQRPYLILSCPSNFSSNIQEIIVAQNKSRHNNSIYYTVSFTLNIKKLENTEICKIHEKTLPLPPGAVYNASSYIR